VFSDEELISGCIKGDSRSQSILFERYSAKLSAVCRRYFKNEDDAKDVFQEGWIKIFNGLVGFKGNSSLETWMTRIMINTSLSVIRSRKQEFFVDVEDAKNAALLHKNQVETDETDNEELPRNANNMSPEDVMKYFDLLPAGYRTVLNLYAVDGYSHKEIASQLNISENTSKTQLLKARKRLKEIIMNQN
jgi:RNA polymerase sigma-70 factor (ECF subfamily)